MGWGAERGAVKGPKRLMTSPAAATHASPRTTRLPLFGVRAWRRQPTLPRQNPHGTEPHTARAWSPRRGAAARPPARPPHAEAASRRESVRRVTRPRSRPRCSASPSRWAAKPGLQEGGVPLPLSLPLLFFFLRGEGWKWTRSGCPLGARPGPAGTPASAGQGAARQGGEKFHPSPGPSLLGTEETPCLSAGKGARVQSRWPRSARQIPSGVGQRKRQPKGPPAGGPLGWAGPPREAGAPRGPGPPSSPRLAREFRSGARGGAGLPPFTPMDGSSFAPAIASTIPTMNHSFLSLSSSRMFVRMGGFCLLVCLFSFCSCVR